MRKPEELEDTQEVKDDPRRQLVSLQQMHKFF